MTSLITGSGTTNHSLGSTGTPKRSGRRSWSCADANIRWIVCSYLNDGCWRASRLQQSRRVPISRLHPFRHYKCDPLRYLRSRQFCAAHPESRRFPAVATDSAERISSRLQYPPARIAWTLPHARLQPNRTDGTALRGPACMDLTELLDSPSLLFHVMAKEGAILSSEIFGSTSDYLALRESQRAPVCCSRGPTFR